MGIRGKLTKPARRPKKIGTDRRRRESLQKKRLIALGMAPEAVEKLNTRQVKDKLKYPAEFGKRG